ncbi:aminoglycoside phosphotransferase family protein [Vibrio kasasachensis]|uniref:phosphotransferase enzyme family protein n=1 Tax=Vibrio kasasachensis TaxID=2910248 RepID=UPI003D0B8FBD
MENLSGGREGVIFKRGEFVVRPLNPWSNSVHQLLDHYKNNGVIGCPQFIAIEDGDKEVLTFVKGDTYNYPLRGAIASDVALLSAAKILRVLHDVSSDFLAENRFQALLWMLPEREPQEVICHGDFTPYNVTLDGEVVTGVFDFDTAHPAPRIWDLAYSIYCWAPFKTDSIDALGDLHQQTDRAIKFCDAYGATAEQRCQLVTNMVERLNALVDYMQQQSKQGNEKFISDIENGHHLSYLADIDYLLKNQKFITSGLLNGAQF